MQSSQDSLIHEATSLFRLVESIDRFVAEHEGLYSYTEATQRLFSHVHGQAEYTRKLASEIIERHAHGPGEPELRYRRDLIIQRDLWRTLHTYIKPATDAHSLNLPAPLIQMATEDLRRVPGLESSHIVVLLTPELMYYHNSPQSNLPSHMVFVEVPYSQGPSFFANLTIYHELGHYVFDRLADADNPRPTFTSLVAAMDHAFAETFGDLLKTPGNRTWAKRVLDSWTKEVFCDLFALRNLGPAYSFALIDILSLIGLMGEDVEGRFDEDHPALALRFREQQKCLQKEGWWTSVENMPSEHVSLVARLAAKNESEYFFEYQEKEVPLFIDAFLAIVPFIHELAADLTPHSEAAAADFAQYAEQIEECLLHGVVPSSLLAEDRALAPTPVSMINAAYCFYLTGLPRLMDKLDGQRADDLRQRMNWAEKVEAWTVKGVEDSQLMVARWQVLNRAATAGTDDKSLISPKR
jgi:hypothetical protein